MKLKKILIANRGEIAMRVISSCREMGIKTVTIYTESDKDLPHALLADESYALGNGSMKETYLNKEKIIEIAKKSGADGIHPGYGFLSENCEFAEMVIKNKLIFIGPSISAIKLMGDKKDSKDAVEKIGVPLIPGYHGDEQSAEFLKGQLAKIGFPVLIKATAGGGGKGMRIVENEKDFDENLAAAKREALNAFGNDRVLLEKYVTRPRHIEVQVLSDSHGQHFHLFERECSIQRRYQKIIEESPSPALSPEKRKEICECAAHIAKSINYLGAGTVEFIWDEDKSQFYFLEMNTRLQVEHPITEMVTGVDLVKLQILVAEGEKLSFKQSDFKQKGHAIEVRIYAEDPDNSFLPTIGTIRSIGKPTLRHVRLETGYADNVPVSINYDPMLAKLVVWSENRAEAITKMVKSLDDVVFLGVVTNRDYLKRVLNHKAFHQGETFTNFVKIHEKDLSKKDLTEFEEVLAIAALSVVENKKMSRGVGKNATTVGTDAWGKLNGLRNT